MSSGSNSRIKNKSKQKIVFAKNKNQAILAMVIAFVFIVNTIYTAIKLYREQNPQPTVAQSEQASNAEDMLAEQPAQKPQDLAEQNQNNIVDAAQNSTIAQDAGDIYSQTVNLQKASPHQNLKTLQNTEGDIEIIPKKTGVKNNGKLVMITVTNSGRSDPFLPAGDNKIFNASYSSLLPPPTAIPTNSDAGKVITTTISGILYDKYNPSAIINIEGADYLVKKGDIINNYKILSISKSQVIVQLGKNVYQAGVGELLSPTDLNYNTIANLNKKFGGNDVSINVRKKGY